MRIVCVSDTHNQNTRIAVPDGDVLIHAGDMTMGGRTAEVRAALQWLASLPHRHKIVVAGNHDWLFERNPIGARELIPPSITYLQDASVTIDGLVFYGSPWQPAFGNWAFNLPRSGERLRRVWSRIPDETDILVTHCPPLGVRDECPDWISGAPVSVGCGLLKRACERVKPELHVFGHIHEGYGVTHAEDGRVFVNAAVCTRDYQPTNPPICVDVPVGARTR